MIALAAEARPPRQAASMTGRAIEIVITDRIGDSAVRVKLGNRTLCERAMKFTLFSHAPGTR